MKRNIAKSVIVILITLFFTVFFWGESLAADPVPDGEPDYPQNETNPEYRISESPYLRVPEDMLNWPDILPPESGTFIASEDPTAVEMYNVAKAKLFTCRVRVS